MSGETGTPQERASKLQHLFLLLVLSWLLVACQPTEEDQESKLASFLYPKLELYMAPLLVRQLCTELAATEGFDIENAEPISYVMQIEAAIAQLKGMNTIPQETITSMEVYARAMAKLESEGRLHTVLGSEYDPTNYFLGKTYLLQRGNCSITTLEDNPRSAAIQIGTAFHEGVHAVLFAQGTEKGEQFAYEKQEPLAKYFGDLVTYGARLAGEPDSPSAERLDRDGIDMPAAAVFLSERGYQFNHPLLRFLESRMYVKWCREILKTWEGTLKTYQNLDDSSEMAKAQQKIDQLHEKRQEFQQPWLDFAWSEADLQVIQDLEQRGLIEPDFVRQ